mmetsp:Transcript_58323/g.102117  ORF Transcript_58323/g.102117 Transcript_58323/m.102117 type:complete len:311 (-) Transcript_58323:194-1126(-)
MESSNQQFVLMNERVAVKEEEASTQLFKGILHACGEFVKCICCPCIPFNCGPVTQVGQGSVGVMTRFGVFERILPPGLYAYNLMSQSIQPVTLKMQTIEIAKQSAMTKDNLSLHVDAVTFVTVVDAGKAIFQVDNYQYAVKTLAASTLLRVIAEHDLQQIFAERAKINDRVAQIMSEKTEGWGLQIAGIEMRDIRIPEALQRAMAQIAEANREADAKVIVAEGQRRAATIFAQAAEIMDKQPTSLQLQWFETLRQIAAEKNSTVIVPESVIGSIGAISRMAAAAGSNPLGPLGVVEDTGSEKSGGGWQKA